MHPDGAEHAVVEDEHPDLQPVRGGGRGLGAGHLEVAVAGDADDGGVGLASFAATAAGMP